VQESEHLIRRNILFYIALVFLGRGKGILANFPAKYRRKKDPGALKTPHSSAGHTEKPYLAEQTSCHSFIYTCSQDEKI
jgi:hypothetical protein